jgi:hypothetical protein
MACDRMIRHSAPLDEILIYIDGFCLDQHVSGDATQRKAGRGVVLKVDSQAAAGKLLKRGFHFA